MWLTWRVGKHLYYHIKDQWNGKYDILTTFQYDHQYEDLFKDNEDMRIVNFRYGDHVDRVFAVSQMPLDSHRIDADKAKEAVKWYRHGNNSLFDWMKQKLF
jgi:hypothetical protein